MFMGRDSKGEMMRGSGNNFQFRGTKISPGTRKSASMNSRPELKQASGESQQAKLKRVQDFIS